MAEAFKQQFEVYRYMSPNNEVMPTPHYRVMQHLSLIKGPLVDDWKADQIANLVEKTTCANNPIGHDKNVLWTEYETAFNNTFTDTTKKQKAQASIKHLRMQDQDLDTYIERFKHLARDAGYNLTALGTADLFALGLRRSLFDSIMYRDYNQRRSKDGSPLPNQNKPNEPNDMPCRNLPTRRKPTTRDHTKQLMENQNTSTQTIEPYPWTSIPRIHLHTTCLHRTRQEKLHAGRTMLQLWQAKPHGTRLPREKEAIYLIKSHTLPV